MPSDCDHPPEKVSHVDGRRAAHADTTLRMWGECECGAPTLVTAEIRAIEYDDDGSKPTIHEDGE